MYEMNKTNEREAWPLTLNKALRPVIAKQMVRLGMKRHNFHTSFSIVQVDWITDKLWVSKKLAPFTLTSYDAMTEPKWEPR